MSKEISGTTSLYCLLGYPAAHSISPRMHNLAFDARSLDCRYLAFDVKPEELSYAVRGLRAIGCGGFNLTMPHKKAILPLLDELSEAAELSGSVNTVVNRDGRLIGYTTDGIGFVRGLQSAGFEPRGKRIVLLGAGGAAESILTQLSLEPAGKISVFRRQNSRFPDTVRFAKKLHASTGCVIEVCPLEEPDALADALADSDLLINTTNVGMEPDTKKSLVPPELLHPGLFVSDIIYHPEQTKLLADAAARGAKTVNGLPMLLYQGAEAFRLWTGQEMPIDQIKEEIL